MNWGYKIMLVYGVFVAGIIFLMVKSGQQNTDLVTANYYDKELVFQQQIDAAKNTQALPHPIQVKDSNQSVLVVLPEEFNQQTILGSIRLYYPANEKKDIVDSIHQQNNRFQIPYPNANKGLHYVILRFTANGKSYYYETKLTL